MTLEALKRKRDELLTATVDARNRYDAALKLWAECNEMVKVMEFQAAIKAEAEKLVREELQRRETLV